MKGDFSRLAFKRAKNYNALLMQQGRALLDADWNEQAQITLDREQGLARSVIGASGAEGPAFRIVTHESLDDFESADGWMDIDEAAGLKVGEVCIDHTQALNGSGSLRVALCGRAGGVWKRLPVPLDLSGRKAFYFWMMIDSDRALQGEALALFDPRGGFLREIQPQAEAALQSGSWIAYRCDIPEPESHVIGGYGFMNLAADITYHFDGLAVAFPVPVGPLDPNAPPEIYVLGGNDACPARMHVDGILCQRERTETYHNQAQYPAPPEIPGLRQNQERLDLVYLDLWQRHITCLEDPGLLEPALGGVDTTTRLETVAQVKVITGRARTRLGFDRRTVPDDLEHEYNQLPRLGGETLTTNPSNEPYEGTENRLYLVEIHNRGRDHATFLWSKDNGISAASLSADLKPRDPLIHLKSRGPDLSNPIKPGDILEISDDVSDLAWRQADPTDLIRLGDKDETCDDFAFSYVPVVVAADGSLEKKSPIGRAYLVGAHARVRRWDGCNRLPLDRSDGSTEAHNSFTLKAESDNDSYRGVNISFGGKNPLVGDFWTFTARVESRTVQSLRNEPAAGIEHHYCKLALLHWIDQPDSPPLLDILDLRPVFHPLTGLQGSDVAYDGGYFQHEARNVQQAIEDLSAQVAAWDRDCTIRVEKGDDIQSVIDGGLLDQGGSIFIPAGIWVLEQSIKIIGKRDITIYGTGATFLVWSGSTPMCQIESSSGISFQGLKLLSSAGSPVFSIKDSSVVCMTQIDMIALPTGNDWNARNNKKLSDITGKAGILFENASSCKLRDSRVLSTIGIEFLKMGTWDLLIENSYVFAGLLGLCARNDSMCTRLNLDHCRVGGWSREIGDLLGELQAAPPDELGLAAIQLGVFGMMSEYTGDVGLAVAISIVGIASHLTVNGGVINGMIAIHRVWGGLLRDLAAMGGDTAILINEIDGTDLDGVHFNGSCIILDSIANMRIENCTFIAGDFSTGGDAAQKQEAAKAIEALPVQYRLSFSNKPVQIEHLAIHNCLFQDVRRGISIGGPGLVGTRDVTITCNSFWWCCDFAIRIISSQGPDGRTQTGHHYIQGNDFYVWGLALDIQCAETEVVGNTICVSAGVDPQVLLQLLMGDPMGPFTAGARDALQKADPDALADQFLQMFQAAASAPGSVSVGAVQALRGLLDALGKFISNCILLPPGNWNETWHQLDNLLVGGDYNGCLGQVPKLREIFRFVLYCGCGIRLRSDFCRVSNNGIWGLAEAPGVPRGGILLDGGNGLGIAIANNRIQGGWGAGVDVRRGTLDLRIEANTMGEGGRGGIAIDFVGSNMVIDGNNVRSRYYPALRIAGRVGPSNFCDNVRISGNTLGGHRTVVRVGSAIDGQWMGQIAFVNNQIDAFGTQNETQDSVELYGRRVVAIGNVVTDENAPTGGCSLALHGQTGTKLVAVGNITSRGIGPDGVSAIAEVRFDDNLP